MRFSRTLPASSTEFHDLQLTVPRGDDGQRLDVTLAAGVPLSRRRIRKAIEDGGVYVNRQRCRTASRTVHADDRLRIVYLDDEQLVPFRPEQILWSQGPLYLLHKKAGQYAQEALHRSRGTLPAELAVHLGLKGADVRPVHRLDRGTSGLILFSTDPATLQRLQRLWSSSAHKEYLAVVEPAPAWQYQRITLPIGSRRDARGRYAVEAAGRACDTEAEVIECRANRALVHLIPHTGRTHQLRVHLAALGCPLLGDSRYGGRPHPRMMLHAQTLSLNPPAWPETVEWHADPEEDWIW
jgi:23S rRNA pseudouridine1911/1915/1917 synthase